MGNKKNYNKMSTDKVKAETVAADVIEETVVTEAIVEKTTKPEPPKTKFGVVTGCIKLNMRVAPKTNAQIRGTLDAGTTVTILGEEGAFYKIGNPENPDYCMKKYITVKK